MIVINEVVLKEVQSGGERVLEGCTGILCHEHVVSKKYIIYKLVILRTYVANKVVKAEY